MSFNAEVCRLIMMLRLLWTCKLSECGSGGSNDLYCMSSIQHFSATATAYCWKTSDSSNSFGTGYILSPVPEHHHLPPLRGISDDSSRPQRPACVSLPLPCSLSRSYCRCWQHSRRLSSTKFTCSPLLSSKGISWSQLTLGCSAIVYM